MHASAIGRKAPTALNGPDPQVRLGEQFKGQGFGARRGHLWRVVRVARRAAVRGGCGDRPAAKALPALRRAGRDHAAPRPSQAPRTGRDRDRGPRSSPNPNELPFRQTTCRNRPTVATSTPQVSPETPRSYTVHLSVLCPVCVMCTHIDAF